MKSVSVDAGFGGITREEDHRKRWHKPSGALCELGAHQAAGHHDIGYEKVYFQATLEEIECCVPAVSDSHPIAERPHLTLENPAQFLIVFHKQHALRAIADRRPEFAFQRHRIAVGCRENQLDRRANTLLGIDSSRTVELPHQTVDHRQAHAGPFTDRLGGIEGLEGARHLLFRHADTRIRDRKEHVASRLQLLLALLDVLGPYPHVRRFDRQSSAVGHRVSRVQREIEERAFGLSGIDLRIPEAATSNRLDLDALRNDPSQHPVHALHQVVEVDGCSVERGIVSEREKLTGQPSTTFHRA